MKWIRLLWPFVLITLAVLVWNYPVYAVSGKIEKASAGKLQVLNSSGSVWAGQMQLGISDGIRVYAIPDAVRWKLQLRQSDNWLAIVVEHPKLLSPLNLGVDGNGVVINGGATRIPASWLGALGAPFNTIRPEGLLQLSWEKWHSGGDMQMSLTWLGAQSALSSVRPLGEYVVNARGNPATNIHVTLASNKGPLILEGSGQWTNGQRFVFTGYASAEERGKEALTGLLSQIGRLEGDKYRLGVF